MALSFAWMAALAIAFAFRVGYPLELEWMEGGTLHQALRFQQGQPIYPEPSAEFVPFLYTPLYPMVVGTLGFVFPLGYTLGRVVSILCVLAVGWGIARIVGRESKPRSHRVVAVGLFCGGYVFSFRWLDVARPDAMMLALVVWALALLRESGRDGVDRRKAVLAGVLMGLAFWTKQTAAVFVLFSGVAAFAVMPGVLPWYAGAVAVVDLGGLAIGQSMTDGWLWTYIYELHQTHAFNEERFRSKTWLMFLHAAPFVVVVLTGLAVQGFRRTIEAVREVGFALRWPLVRGDAVTPVFWGTMLAAGLLASGTGYATQWAEPNAFIPGVCMGAIFLGVVLPKEGRVASAALGALAGQLAFALLVEPRYQPVQDRGWAGLSESYTWQDPSRTIPTTAKRDAARAVRDTVESIDGELLALQRPWWTVLAGGTPHVGSMGINDVPKESRLEIQKTIRERVRSGEPEAVFVEGSLRGFAWLQRDLARKYRLEKRWAGDARATPMVGFMSEAGMVTPYRGVQMLFVRAEPSQPENGVEVIFDFETGLRGWNAKGPAFRRAVRSIHGKTPPVGPIGGKKYLSSAATKGLKAKGSTVSPEFTLGAEGSELRMLVGVQGRAEDVSVTLIRVDDSTEWALELPETAAWTLSEASWTVPAPWAGAKVQMRLDDRGTRAALFLDEVRLHSL